MTLWGWAHFGDSEWWLRLWSVVGGALALAAVYLLAVRFIERRVAIAATVLLFCNSAFMYYLTELRAYSWVMCCAVVTIILFVRFRTEPTTKNAVLWGASVGLMLGLLVFTAGLVVAQAAFTWPLWKDRLARRRVVLAAGVALAVLSPFIPALATSDQVNWIQPTTFHIFIVNICGAIGGTRWTIVLGLGNVALLASFRVKALRRPHDLALQVTGAGLVALPTMLLLISFVQPAFISRYLTSMAPLAMLGAIAGYLRVAAALPLSVTQRRAGIVLAAAVVVVGVLAGFSADISRPEDMRAPARLLSSHVAPGDAVVFNAELIDKSVRYYWTPVGTVFAQDLPGHVYSEATQPGFCHVWYYYRMSPAELLQWIGRSESDPNVVVEGFFGYSVAEVELCP